MAETERPRSAKKLPKGGRRGGATFPKINLKQALVYAKKLVSKTHTGPQTARTILPGVFGNAGPRGKIRASALKQYGLLEGEADGYKATKLAKQIEAAPANELEPLLQKSILTSKLFSQIFETFHGDTVSKAKIEQCAKGLNVHPDSAGECAQLFVESAVTAGLGVPSGDSIILLTAAETTKSSEQPLAAETAEGEVDEEELGEFGSPPEVNGTSTDKGGPEPVPQEFSGQSTKPHIALTLNVDPSSDPDKLEKQLKLLRQYGII